MAETNWEQRQWEAAESVAGRQILDQLTAAFESLERQQTRGAPGFRESVRAGVEHGRNQALGQYFRLDPVLVRRRVGNAVVETGVLLLAARATSGRVGRVLRVLAARRVVSLAVSGLVLPGLLQEGRRRVASLDATARETLGV